MKMKLLLAALVVAAGFQDPGNERLKAALKDTDLVGTWIYDDLDLGYAEARKSGKAMMVVFRCVP